MPSFEQLTDELWSALQLLVGAPDPRSVINAAMMAADAVIIAAMITALVALIPPSRACLWTDGACATCSPSLIVRIRGICRLPGSWTFALLGCLGFSQVVAAPVWCQRQAVRAVRCGIALCVLGCVI